MVTSPWLSQGEYCSSGVVLVFYLRAQAGFGVLAFGLRVWFQRDCTAEQTDAAFLYLTNMHDYPGCGLCRVLLQLHDCLGVQLEQERHTILHCIPQPLFAPLFEYCRVSCAAA
jgi:hypothetical protein